MSYVVAPRRRAFGDASSSAAGAAVGTAVAGPVGTAVGGLVGGLFHSGSPRYEGGPLLSSVQQRLGQLKNHDATAIAQTHQDALSGGAGWKDVALVLAPLVLPGEFPPPVRALTSQEAALVAPFVTAGSVPTGVQAIVPTAPGAAKPATLVAGFPGGTVGLVVGLGILGAILVRPKRRARR